MNRNKELIRNILIFGIGTFGSKLIQFLLIPLYSIYLSSRNNQCGYLIGQGYKPNDAIKQVGMVVEGINVLPAAIQLSRKYNVELPLISAVNDIINCGIDPQAVVTQLMGRNFKSELRKPVLDAKYESAVLKNTTLRTKGDQGMKRVITYGTFDLLHYGHINLLRRAKALGDYLIVVISSDEFNWNEKHKKCYFTYEQRKALVEAIRYVDLVIPEESWNQKRSDMHEYHINTFVILSFWSRVCDARPSSRNLTDGAVAWLYSFAYIGNNDLYRRTQRGDGVF